MTITINGTTGIAGVDGSASTPAVQGADTNTGIFFPAADTIGFSEGGAEVARFDSSGNLGIGTSSPVEKLHVAGKIAVSGTNPSIRQTVQTANLDLCGGTTVGTDPSIQICGSSNPTDANFIFYNSNSHVFRNSSGSTERARITSGGFFKASNTGTYLGGVNATVHEFENSTSAQNIAYFTNSSATPYGPLISFSAATPNNTTNYFLNFADSTNDKCTIFSSGTISNRTGTYNTLSDLKLKQDIVDANSQWDDIKALRIVKYRLKDEVAADPNYPAHIGVIAQEVEQVSPGLVDDCIDKDSGEVTKSVKSSIIYMKAVKTLQEAMVRIETLEAQNAAFEARLAALENK